MKILLQSCENSPEVPSESSPGGYVMEIFQDSSENLSGIPYRNPSEVSSENFHEFLLEVP